MGEVTPVLCLKTKMMMFVCRTTEKHSNENLNIIANVNVIYKIMCNCHLPFLHGSKRKILSVIDAYMQIFRLAVDKNKELWFVQP